jgi:hypothetical protein
MIARLVCLFRGHDYTTIAWAFRSKVVERQGMPALQETKAQRTDSAATDAWTAAPSGRSEGARLVRRSADA